MGEANRAYHKRDLGSEMTLAQWLARKAIKAEYAARGLKLSHIEPRAVTLAARAYLASHPELIEQARATLASWESARRANLSSAAHGSEA